MERELPPWEPIADWLCRIEDGDHGNTTARERRKYHEEDAKAIAYDIAMYGDGDESEDTIGQASTTTNLRFEDSPGGYGK